MESKYPDTAWEGSEVLEKALHILHHINCAFKFKKLCWSEGIKLNETGKGRGRSEASLSSHSTYKGEMLIGKGIWPPPTPERDDLSPSLQTAQFSALCSQHGIQSPCPLPLRWGAPTTNASKALG